MRWSITSVITGGFAPLRKKLVWGPQPEVSQGIRRIHRASILHGMITAVKVTSPVLNVMKCPAVVNCASTTQCRSARTLVDGARALTTATPAYHRYWPRAAAKTSACSGRKSCRPMGLVQNGSWISTLNGCFNIVARRVNNMLLSTWRNVSVFVAALVVAFGVVSFVWSAYSFAVAAWLSAYPGADTITLEHRATRSVRTMIVSTVVVVVGLLGVWRSVARLRRQPVSRRPPDG